MNKKSLKAFEHSVLVGVVIALTALSVGAVDAPPPFPMPAAGIAANSTGATLAASPEAKATPAYMSYIYYGDHYRDPFIPLNGDVRTADSFDRAPQMGSLVLKGIVQDANGRMALLTGGGNSYILRSGRLYDGRNRAVKKISGVIKTDSVVLIGADRTVRELKTKTEL